MKKREWCSFSFPRTLCNFAPMERSSELLFCTRDMFSNRAWKRVSSWPSDRPRFLNRQLATAASPYRVLDVLHRADVDTFRQQCFAPEQPGLFPPSHFRDLPAIPNWFRHAQQSRGPAATRLNVEYLQSHAADAFVPLELTEAVAWPSENRTGGPTHDVATEIASFRQFNAPFTLFLDWMRAAETAPQSARLYLAQCQLLDLPPILRRDFPTPDLVAQAGKGDVYDTNVWIGHPPTYTPLHRDPNPNLFVQLAGQKVVRLLPPADGLALFSAVRGRLGKSGGKDAAAFRGEEMMQGQERALLDEMVWGVPVSAGTEGSGYEASLEAGDGLFIPKGWWHSIKGIGEGVTASVSVLFYTSNAGLLMETRLIGGFDDSLPASYHRQRLS